MKLTHFVRNDKRENKYNKSTKWDKSEWSCTILCMGGGGTFGVQIVPQNIEKNWKIRHKKKVLSVSLDKHKDFKARHDKIHVSAY